MASASQTNTSRTTWLRDWASFNNRDIHTLTLEESHDYNYWLVSKEEVFMIYKREDGSNNFKVTADQSRYQKHQFVVAIFKFKSAMKKRKQLCKIYDFIYNHDMTIAEVKTLVDYMIDVYPTHIEVLNRSMIQPTRT